MAEPTPNELDFVALAAEITSAYACSNRLPAAELPALIHAVHASLLKLGGGAPSIDVAPAAPTAAVSKQKSITSDYLVCLDDGLKFKSLKRHLGKLGMTPDQYRAKWGLSADYPMVAPKYAAARSALAKKIGLGQMRGAAGKKGGLRAAIE